MLPERPLAQLPTHEVFNTPPHMGDQDLWNSDRALKHWTSKQGAGWAEAKLAEFGRSVGTAENFERARQANRFPPELKAFDRYGMWVNQVDFHPAYHDLMTLAIENEVPNFAWRHEQPGAQVAHAAMTYMFAQVEGGVLCPMAMTYAAIPSLRLTPAIGAEWIPRLLSTSYDPRDIPVEQKTGATMGMFMTEKQGGSDVRANTTRAEPIGAQTGPGAAYHLTGHKFFCSAPMCDAFLSLAYTDGGQSCFLIPRWRPDGTRNGLYIQRLKDKLGNRSNASSEMEFQDTYAIMLGDEGRGVRTIIEMVQGNRMYCAMASAGMMRQGLVQALHHTMHRSAFQKRIIQQPLMRNVLADLALEVEGALAFGLRVARAMDEAANDEDAAAFARVGTAIAKFWNCRRASDHVCEALECHGGPGYVEESIMPRMYREAPVNSIWEGSANIMCLDVLRALAREPRALPSVFSVLEQVAGSDQRLDNAVTQLRDALTDPKDAEFRARALTSRMAIALQAALLIQHAPAAVSEAYIASRLGGEWFGGYGNLPAGLDIDAILARALPNASHDT